jgi:hypothetical protein
MVLHWVLYASAILGCKILVCRHSCNNETNATQVAWTTMIEYGSSASSFQGTLERIDSENNNMPQRYWDRPKSWR